jgi:hypothetical protein
MKIEQTCPTNTDPWNFKVIDGPPIVTFDYTPNEYETRFTKSSCLVIFQQHLERLLGLIEVNRSFFVSERTLLEKLIYKNWNSLRKEKAMQSMRRLRIVLNSFEQMSFINVLKTLTNLLATDKSFYQLDNLNKTLPSREVFEHFIVRLYGASKLLEFAQQLIRDHIFFFLVKSIQMAVFLPNNLLFLGTVSRLYCISKKVNSLIT